jgi:dolichyl-phosphate-mannose-protein mannosyltransferase
MVRAEQWRRALIESAGVFLGVFILLMAVHASRMQYTNDEGIILEAAQRMASGEKLYIDFFGYMSPGSYYLQAAVFELFGLSMWTARLPVILDFSLQCALIFWLVRRLASSAAAAAGTALFVGLLLPTPGLLTAQHRWDSSTLCLLSITLAVQGVFSGRRAWWLVSGAAIGAAVFVTPTVGVVAAITVIWLALSPARRSYLPAYAAGGIMVGAIGLLALNSAGILTACIRQMMWLRDHYSGVNIMPYGSVIGGYGLLFDDVSGFRYLIVGSLVLCVALPAILPIFGSAGWIVAKITGRSALLGSEQSVVMTYLVACAIGLVATAYPRPDVMHLTFVSAVMFVIATVLINRCFPSLRYVYCYLLFWVVLMFGNNLSGRLSEYSIGSPVGDVSVGSSHGSEMERLLRIVRPDDTMYIHPYRPVLYFMTQSRNPTRYSYLAPGMMTAEDERSVLESLNSTPPRWVLHLPLSQEEFLRVFPNATGLNHRFERTESWIEEYYEPLDEPLVVSGYRVLRRKTAGREHSSLGQSAPPLGPPILATDTLNDGADVMVVKYAAGSAPDELTSR